MADAPTKSSPPRFTLAGLLELVAGIGLSLALVTQLESVGLGMAIAGFLVIAVAHYVAFAKCPRQAASNVWVCLITIVVGFLLIGMLMPAVNTARWASRRSPCRYHLQELAFALQRYELTNGRYPPPYVADAQGKPMHSWRVLILPYLERGDLFAAYNFQEPWDGPNNSKLAARMPAVFRCPSDTMMPEGMTSYFCVVGPGRTKGANGLKESDIRDGPSTTVALVESSTARINWLDPRDLRMEDILAGENTLETPCPCSRHGRQDHGMWRSAGGGSYNVAMFATHIQTLPSDLDAKTLQALLTIDGGEAVDIDSIPWPPSDEYLWPGFWVLLAAEAVFVALAIVRRVRLARWLSARSHE